MKLFKSKKKMNTAPDSEQKGKRGVRALTICLALLVVFMASFGVSFAKYRSEAKLELGTAGVAAWAVSAGAETWSNLFIDCNTSESVASYGFWVKNSNSEGVAEVAILYSVQVELSDALPTGLSIQIDGLDATSVEGKVYTFTSADWAFEAGVAGNVNHTLTFTADPKIVENDFTVSAINITVVAEQID